MILLWEMSRTTLFHFCKRKYKYLIYVWSPIGSQLVGLVIEIFVVHVFELNHLS